MQILPINQNNKTNFKAVNQKYYKMAKKGIENKLGVSSEVFTKLRYDVDWGDIHPQDGIDTIEAIKKIMGKTNTAIEHVLEGFRAMLKK